MLDQWPNAYLHTLNPFAVRFTETFGIRWYGLAYLAGFILGYLFISWLARRKLTVLEPEQVSDFVFAVAIGTIVGGRLGYCLFYAPEILTRFTAAPPFWGVLAINEGGMASHGGIVGVICACLLYARRHKISVLALLDLTTIGGSIGIFFGRVANFVNGELVGRPAPENFPLAVKFPQDILLWPAEAPEKVRELVKVIGAAAPPNGSDSMLLRVVAEIQSGNIVLAEQLRPLLLGRHPSQLYQGLLEGALIFLFLLLLWRRPRKPGVIAGWFLVLYPIVRIVGEQFRMPDPHIGYQLFGLTRGQWLSIVMLAITSGLLVFWSKRSSIALGGWGTRSGA